MRFSQLVPWKHESVGRVLSEPQLGTLSDVWGIMSTQKGSVVFILHPTSNIPSITIRCKNKYCVIRACDINILIIQPYQILDHHCRMTWMCNKWFKNVMNHIFKH